MRRPTLLLLTGSAVLSAALVASASGARPAAPKDLRVRAVTATSAEVAAGEIRHALRVTVESAQRAFIHPATHYCSSTNPDDPPMGLRLKASYDISGYHGQARVILEALQRYGLIVADQGTSWYISGAADPRWEDDDLDQLKRVPGSAFEVVQSGPVLKP